MRAVKARYSNGRIELPPDVPEHEPCEVTVLFPDSCGAATDLDDEAFVRAAGGWKDMDCEELKRRIYEARKVSLRPKPQL